MENENLNQTKEKMIKKCRIFGKILLSVKWIVIIGMVLATVLLFTLGVEIYNNNEEVDVTNEMMQESNINENIENLDFNNVTMQENNINENVEQGSTEIGTIIGTITGFFTVIGNFVLIDSLGKIFINISKEGTPFTNNIIKSIKDICIFSTIIWFLGIFSSVGNIGLVWLLVIWAMYYIFKYGYQLQLESDETL